MPEKTKLSIKTVGESVLARKVREVPAVTDEHRRLLSAMAQVMYEVKGVGLAAPQVGIEESLAVIDIGTGLYKLVNPRIVSRRGRQSMEEGCLSVPGIGVRVRRSRSVVVESLDENGKPLRIEAEGLLATVFQHELDHLNGTLIVDRASVIERLRFKKALVALKNRTRTAQDQT